MRADYTTYPDGELVGFLQNGDHKAYRELYMRYWDKLFYLAGKKLEDLYEAEHIVQDVFLDIWDRRAFLDITGSFEGYLVVAVKYRIINFQVKRSRDRQRDQLVSGMAPGVDNPTEKWMDFEELQVLLRDQVSRLPEKCGLAFRLRQDGLSYREIADQMDISERTVQMHLTHARKSLKAGLGVLVVFFNFL